MPGLELVLAGPETLVVVIVSAFPSASAPISAGIDSPNRGVYRKICATRRCSSPRVCRSSACSDTDTNYLDDFGR